MNEPRQMTITELSKEISRKLSEFVRLLKDASTAKSDKDLNSIMFMYSPEEWEQIAITIKHYDYAMKMWKECKTSEQQLEWCETYWALLGYIRDMVASWYDRIDKAPSEA